MTMNNRASEIYYINWRPLSFHHIAVQIEHCQTYMSHVSNRSEIWPYCSSIYDLFKSSAREGQMWLIVIWLYPWEIYEGHMEVEYVIGLSGTFAHSYSHTIWNINTYTHANTVHTKYIVTYTFYEHWTEFYKVSQEAACVGFWTGSDLPLIRYKLSPFREKAFNGRIINIKSLRCVTPGTVCIQDEASKVKTEEPKT